MGESPWMEVPIHSSQIATILVSICQRHEDGRENSKLTSRSADVKAEQKKAQKTSQEGGAQKCVERCCEMARKTSDQFHKFSIPCFDDHQKEPDDLGIVGEVSETCSQIVLEFLYLARIGRPDPLWPVNCWARSVTKWNQACDLRLARLISYIHQKFDHKHYCHVGNQTIHCKLGLFQDADFGGQLTDSTSRSGGVLCIFESHTFVPNPSACKNQTPVSHSSTEAEIISLGARLRMEGIPAMNLSDTIMDMVHPQAGGDSKPVHRNQIPKHHESFEDIHDVLPNARSFSMNTSLYLFNVVVMKQISNGRSPAMRLVSRTHRVDWDRLYDQREFKSND